MNKSQIRAMAAIGLLGTLAGAYAQDSWGNECIDPMNTAPRSTPYLTATIRNSLIGITLGVDGTVTYGGTNGPCFGPTAVTADITGKFALYYGSNGSNQRTSENFSDNNLNLTFGAPFDPIGCYAATSVDGTRTRFGSGGLGTTFVGHSNRYMYTESTNDGILAALQIETVADAIRFRWRMTNTDTAASHTVGLYFGAYVAMLTGNFQTSTPASGSASISHYPLNTLNGLSAKLGYVVTDKGRPPVTDHVYDRGVDAGSFPTYADFVFGQSDYQGFRMEMQPSQSTDDVTSNQPNQVDGLWIGKNGFLLGGLDDAGAAFPLAVLPDTDFLDGTGFVTRIPETTLASGATMQILQYVRSTWGVSDYKLPYGVAVDAPKTVSARATNFSGGATVNGLNPNPMAIRVYVDNVGGYAFDEKEFPLNDVRVRLSFGQNAGVSISGASASAAYTRELTLPVVNPQQLRFVDFTATIGPDTAGPVPYTVTIDSQPGNVHKELNGVINVASRSRIELFKDANMVSIPFEMANTSCDAIFDPFLDPNVPGGDAQYYAWDPIQNSYVIVNSVPRGQGFFVIYDKAGDSSVIADYGGGPSTPGGFLDGTGLVQLRRGFNIIGNPYNYRIPINQIAGVTASAPQISYKFDELVGLGLVQSFLTTWNPITKDYEFVTTSDGFLEPHKAYWINVLSEDPLTINYPSANELGIPDMSRKPKPIKNLWPQTDNAWRLRLTARSGDSVDGENYIAHMSDAVQASRNAIAEAPMSPTQQLGLSIEQQVGGNTTRMAQATSTSASGQWTIKVTAKKAGKVTLNWPNLGSLPKNLRFRVTDPATQTSRSMRQSSGYTFTMDKPGTRELTVTAEVGGSDTAVIGNVVVSRPSRAPNAPFTISYTLGSDATTSVRVLSGTGKEVYVATRGRADRAGENTVTWNLRNSANQAVAPGTYLVEILAESTSGERVRRSVPINVVR